MLFLDESTCADCWMGRHRWLMMSLS